MCPKQLLTWKSSPSIFSMVLALAGDSTINRFFAIRFRWYGYSFGGASPQDEVRRVTVPIRRFPSAILRQWALPLKTDRLRREEVDDGTPHPGVAIDASVPEPLGDVEADMGMS